MLGKKTIYLETVNSTNSYLKELTNREIVEEGTIVCAQNQTAGRGQRGNVWLSEDNKNLLFSFVVYPRFLAAERQFLLSKITALAVADFLKEYVENIQIKWANDIYINDLKIAGILIEHAISGINIEKTIVGVGLNVNQREFDKSLPNPTSMSLHTGKEYDLRVLLNELCVKFDFWYGQLFANNVEMIDNMYIKLLYRFGIKSWFEDQNGKFQATIDGINSFGQLCMTDEANNQRVYSFKEVSFCIN